MSLFKKKPAEFTIWERIRVFKRSQEYARVKALGPVVWAVFALQLALRFVGTYFTRIMLGIVGFVAATHVAGPHWFIWVPILLLVLFRVVAPRFESKVGGKIGKVVRFVSEMKRRSVARAKLIHAREVLTYTMSRTIFESVQEASENLTLSRTVADGIIRADFQVPHGFQAQELEREFPTYSSSLRSIRYIPLKDDERDGYESVLFCAVDPLKASLNGWDAPVLHLTEDERCDPHHWLPVGIDSTGQLMSVPSFQTATGSVRMLTSGLSGTGKSSNFVQILLQNTMNPNVDVFVGDGKGSELGMFAPYVRSYADDSKSFFAQMEDVEGEVRRHAMVLQDSGDRLWTLEHGNFIKWSVDELALLESGMDAPTLKEFFKRLGGITAVARSLGISVDFVSQSFKSTVLPTEQRDAHYSAFCSYRTGSATESGYVGFDSTDTVRPDLIKGRAQRSGADSSAGQFAIKGLDNPTYGKSFYLEDAMIKDALSRLEPFGTEVEKGQVKVVSS